GDETVAELLAAGHELQEEVGVGAQVEAAGGGEKEGDAGQLIGHLVEDGRQVLLAHAPAVSAEGPEGLVLGLNEGEAADALAVFSDQGVEETVEIILGGRSERGSRPEDRVVGRGACALEDEAGNVVFGP